MALIGLGFLALLEGGLRLAEAGGWVKLEPRREVGRDDGEWYVLSPTLGWLPRPGYEGPVYGAHRRFDRRGLAVADGRQLEEGTGRARLVILGDSRAFGFGVPFRDTFGERLDARLPRAVVINLAVPGYSCYQVLRSLEERALALDPDLVLVVCGFNDRRYVLSPEDEDAAAFPRAAELEERRRLLAASRTLAALGGVLARWERALEPRPVDLGALTPRVPPEVFQRALGGIAERCRRAAVPVVFLLLGDDPERAATPDRIAALFAAGNEAGAARSLRAAGAFGELARLRLAELYERRGEPGDAARAAELRRAEPRRSLHGGTVIRDQEEYAALTRAAARRHGVPVIDGARLLARHPEVYTDSCHFDARGHALLARRLLIFLERRYDWAAEPRKGDTP